MLTHLSPYDLLEIYFQKWIKVDSNTLQICDKKNVGKFQVENISKFSSIIFDGIFLKIFFKGKLRI